MSETPDTLPQTERPFEVMSVAACAEDPNQVQLEGSLSAELSSACFDLFQAAGWSVFRVGNNGSLVARLRSKAMFILQPDTCFTLSRLKDLSEGMRLLDDVFMAQRPTDTASQPATPISQKRT